MKSKWTPTQFPLDPQKALVATPSQPTQREVWQRKSWKTETVLTYCHCNILLLHIFKIYDQKKRKKKHQNLRSGEHTEGPSWALELALARKDPEA